MTPRLSLQLGVVAAVYLLWLVSWAVFDPGVFGHEYDTWDETLVAIVGAIAAFAASWRTARPWRVFLAMLGMGLMLLAVSWATYDPAEIRPFLGVSGQGEPDASGIGYAAFTFVWVCAWGYLALELWNRRPPSALTGMVFALLMVGLAVILTSFYYPQYGSSLDTVAGRLDAVTSGLEFGALVIGLACVLLGIPAASTWMLFATALLVASDLGYTEVNVPAAIEPVWMLGQFLLFAALLALPATTAAAPDRSASPPVHESTAHPSPMARAGFGATSPPAPMAQQRSGLSGVLILLSLGGVLLSVAVGLFEIHPIWKSFYSVVFVVALVVLLVWLTDRFDETVEYLKIYTARLHRQRLEGEDWQDADARIRAALQSTGLGSYLDALRGSADRLKQDVLFLGPERLYPAPKPHRASGQVRCFIVMPFSLEWSDDVHRTLAEACRAASVQPVRGDDLFTPTDIIVDIWHGIHGADFVIADITGRNPNVLYELGIAHTLAKPVLIISRNAADIPIDLSTRRVILYGRSGGDWRDDLRTTVARAIAEIRVTYGLTPAAPDATGRASESMITAVARPDAQPTGAPSEPDHETTGRMESV